MKKGMKKIIIISVILLGFIGLTWKAENDKRKTVEETQRMFEKYLESVEKLEEAKRRKQAREFEEDMIKDIEAATDAFDELLKEAKNF